MRTAIIAGLAVIAFVAGAFLFYPSSPVTAAAPSTGEPVKPNFVELPPVHLPVMGERRTRQVVELRLVVEVSTPEDVEAFAAREAHIQDALLQNLYGAFDESMKNGEAMDIERLKRKTAFAVASVMGREAVKDILIDHVRERRM